MLNISDDLPGLPAYSELTGNSYCGATELISDNVTPEMAESWHFNIADNVDLGDC